MNSIERCIISFILVVGAGMFALHTNFAQGDEPTAKKEIRIGIIGLDTSHVPAFVGVLNDPKAEPDVAGCRVIAAYPHGSADIESSASRIPLYTKQMQEQGLEIVDSIDDLLAKVDCVLLETNDGRLHLEQARRCFQAKKPVFIDKPLAASLADCIAIFELAKQYDTPVFSSSSLRHGKLTQAARAGALGHITYCEGQSPATIEKTHPEMFWYAIHGVESLYTVLGTGCETVQRNTEDGKLVVTGKWSGDRTGLFRELPKGYGGVAKGSKGEGPVGQYEGYRPLVVDIVQFFRTGVSPVSPEETLEIYTFMEAADESKRHEGAEIKLADVFAKAKAEAEKKVMSFEK